MSDTLVGFKGVALGYAGKQVLRDLDLAVQRGDFLGIVGPNGSGKTTILRAVLGLLRPTAGTLVLGTSPEGGRLHLGYVPQRETLDERFPLSVLDVVMMGRYRRAGRIRRPDALDREQVETALRAVGMEGRSHTLFRNLSGGQKQRALIARALAGQVDLLVLDEPTSGMDLGAESRVMNLVDRIHRDRSLTVLLVSHQLNTVARWVRRLGLLHEGRLAVGDLDEILTGESLSRVYGEGTRVETVGGRRVVLPPGGASS